MDNPILKTVFVITTLLLIEISAAPQSGQLKDQSASASNSDSITFTKLVTQYANSIKEADTVSASKFWSKSPEVSFINPRGNE